MKKNNLSRKDFIRTSGLGMAGFVLSMNARGYNSIPGANDTIRVAVIGLNGRGQAHIASLHNTPDCRIQYVCDVDSDILSKRQAWAEKLTGYQIKAEKDFRKVLAAPDVDAITIATPGHWHTPMAILAVKAGKHVYVEKPFSVTPQEGEWMIEIQEKYPKIVMQMGNQQRSAQTSQEAVALIRDGLIGDPYYAKAWYSNNRGSIGTGKNTPVPGSLDWNLWQGPAPHEPFRDNLVPYNWHWFWNWGTGELGNNSVHELDFCRWALGLDYPTRVTSSGGRYAFQDDWQFYDTQTVDYEYEKDGKKKLLNWEGLSCSPYEFFGRGRGSLIRGTKGSMIVDRSGYQVFDMKNKLIKEAKEARSTRPTTENNTNDTVGGGVLTDKHFENFIQTILGKQKGHSPMVEGHKSVLLAHLGNIAQKTGHVLNTDPLTGRIQWDTEAMQMWTRDYEQGWKPEV